MWVGVCMCVGREGETWLRKFSLSSKSAHHRGEYKNVEWNEFEYVIIWQWMGLQLHKHIVRNSFRSVYIFAVVVVMLSLLLDFRSAVNSIVRSYYACLSSQNLSEFIRRLCVVCVNKNEFTTVKKSGQIMLLNRDRRASSELSRSYPYACVRFWFLEKRNIYIQTKSFDRHRIIHVKNARFHLLRRESEYGTNEWKPFFWLQPVSSHFSFFPSCPLLSVDWGACVCVVNSTALTRWLLPHFLWHIWDPTRTIFKPNEVVGCCHCYIFSRSMRGMCRNKNQRYHIQTHVLFSVSEAENLCENLHSAENEVRGKKMECDSGVGVTLETETINAWIRTQCSACSFHA